MVNWKALALLSCVLPGPLMGQGYYSREEPYSWQEEVFVVPDNCVEFRNREQPGVSDTTHNLQLDDIEVEIFVDRRSNAPDYMAAFAWPSGWIATPVDLLVEENKTGTICFKKWIGV